MRLDQARSPNGPHSCRPLEAVPVPPPISSSRTARPVMPVVDASVVVDWVAPDVGARAPARRLLSKLVADGDDLAAPRLLMEEVGNALLTGVRRARWDGAAADAAFG